MENIYYDDHIVDTTATCECGTEFHPLCDNDTLCPDCEADLYQRIVEFRLGLTAEQAKRYDVLSEGLYLNDFVDNVNRLLIENRERQRARGLKVLRELRRTDPLREVYHAGC